MRLSSSVYVVIFEIKKWSRHGWKGSCREKIKTYITFLRSRSKLDEVWSATTFLSGPRFHSWSIKLINKLLEDKRFTYSPIIIHVFFFSERLDFLSGWMYLFLYRVLGSDVFICVLKTWWSQLSQLCNRHRS